MAPPVGVTDPRARELADRLQAVRDRIETAAAAAGRDAGSLTLVAVTKTYGIEDVRRLAALGVTDFGENRDQEAQEKAAAEPGVRWHFVGRLQRNKARSVAGYACCVHSVDRPELVDALDRAADQNTAPLDVFVQVSLDGDAQRGGVPVEDLAPLADRVAGRAHLRLRGLMGVPSISSDPDRAYAELAGLAEGVRRDHPGADALSAGMSGDLESAVRAGATHLRVGTALLGDRPVHLG